MLASQGYLMLASQGYLILATQGLLDPSQSGILDPRQSGILDPRQSGILNHIKELLQLRCRSRPKYIVRFGSTSWCSGVCRSYGNSNKIRLGGNNPPCSSA
ncbi:hypothetical protein AVEN_158178-1 [Araneus ventricosus]|uniref:Uncharacterized protein n=1 Tax=Araneus ventricosus TaxID=182803 RepID=A0A4Y2G7N5_ARAVE|nr:hypothetical protein AVEN_158178-1 [Araneus ventricosus]